MKWVNTKKRQALFATAAAFILVSASVRGAVVAEYSDESILNVSILMNRRGFTELRLVSTQNVSSIWYDAQISTPLSWHTFPPHSAGWYFDFRVRFDPAPDSIEGISLSKNTVFGTGCCAFYNIQALGAVQWGLNSTIPGWTVYDILEAADGGWWVIWGSNTNAVTYSIWKTKPDGQLESSRAYGPYPLGSWFPTNASTAGSAIQIVFAKHLPFSKLSNVTVTLDASGFEVWSNEIISTYTRSNSSSSSGTVTASSSITISVINSGTQTNAVIPNNAQISIRE